VRIWCGIDFMPMSADVCVVGSFMADLVVRVARRPERGETVVGDGFDIFLGGKGFNQAVAAARSGARTAMVGALGDDEHGHAFRAALARDGIDHLGVRMSSTTGTGVAFPVVEASGDNSIVIVPRANHTVGAGDVQAAAATVGSCRVLLLQLELPVAAAVEAARIAHAGGAIVVLNPAPAVASLDPFAGLVDVVVPNETEAATLTGGLTEPAEQAARLRELLGAPHVVITLGARGVLVTTPDSHELITAHAVDCVDTVGAGDAFCGGLAARLADGASMVDAARYGNAAGALATTRAGAEPSMPVREDVDALLRRAAVVADA
jgi:ribokinase